MWFAPRWRRSCPRARPPGWLRTSRCRHFFDAREPELLLFEFLHRGLCCSGPAGGQLLLRVGDLRIEVDHGPKNLLSGVALLRSRSLKRPEAGSWFADTLSSPPAKRVHVNRIVFFLRSKPPLWLTWLVTSASARSRCALRACRHASVRRHPDLSLVRCGRDGRTAGDLGPRRPAHLEQEQALQPLTPCTYMYCRVCMYSYALFKIINSRFGISL